MLQNLPFFKLFDRRHIFHNPHRKGCAIKFSQQYTHTTECNRNECAAILQHAQGC